MWSQQHARELIRCKHDFVSQNMTLASSVEAQNFIISTPINKHERMQMQNICVDFPAKQTNLSLTSTKSSLCKQKRSLTANVAKSGGYARFYLPTNWKRSSWVTRKFALNISITNECRLLSWIFQPLENQIQRRSAVKIKPSESLLAKQINNSFVSATIKAVKPRDLDIWDTPCEKSCLTKYQSNLSNVTS